MGKNSKIEWTATVNPDGTVRPGHTWNPWRGCHKVTEECRNCYMYREQEHYGNDPSVVVRSKTTFRDPLKWREPARIFVCSWSDFWIEEADRWREEAYDVMCQARQHTYIIPTKRPENIASRLPSDWGNGWPNIWGLVSAGTQESADQFIPQLLQLSFAVYGVSVEPMLGPVELSEEWFPLFDYRPLYDFYPPEIRGDGKPIPIRSGLGWIIIGCESGPRRRPLRLEDAADLVGQGRTAGIPVFVKQLDIDGKVSKDPNEWPEELRVREFPI